MDFNCVDNLKILGVLIASTFIGYLIAYFCVFIGDYLWSDRYDIKRCGFINCYDRRDGFDYATGKCLTKEELEEREKVRTFKEKMDKLKLHLQMY